MFLDTSIANFASADLDFADGICLIGFQINMTRSVLVRLVSPSSDTDTDLCSRLAQTDKNCVSNQHLLSSHTAHVQ